MSDERNRYISGQRALYGLDIETACNVAACSGHGCKHALDPHRSKITVIGITNGLDVNKVFRGPNKVAEALAFFVNRPDAYFTAHNGKFDVKMLTVHSNGGGQKLLEERWLHDSSLLAFTSQDKIPASWLDGYEAQRRMLNKTRRGNAHRAAGPHSLKTLAPYFLNVAPFWEAEDHDNDEYVLKDALYSLQLTEYFLERLPQASLNFYTNKFLPWTKNLLNAELTGVRIDLEALDSMLEAKTAEELELNKRIESLWAPHFAAYLEMQRDELRANYDEKLTAAIAKSPKNAEKARARYQKLYYKAASKIQPLNIGSPAQLTWLLRERLNLNPVGLDGEPSTDKEALELLSEQSADVRLLLQARKLSKLTTAFLPAYKEVHTGGRIYANFNVTSARTGRLSCSEPNLQQVSSELRSLFVANENHKLIFFDLSAIEPTVLAYYSEDPELCKLMINKSDFHGTTAKYMFELDCDPAEVKKLYPKYRAVAKTVGLAILYGAGRNQVYRTLLQNGLHQFTLEDARSFVYKIRDLYAGVWKFKKELDSEMEKGAVIYNLLGRPIKIQDPQDCYMQALNTLVQSSASDLLQESGYLIKQELGLQPLLLVHDEIVFQAPIHLAKEKGKQIEMIMTSFELPTRYGNIPIKVEGKEGREWEK